MAVCLGDNLVPGLRSGLRKYWQFPISVYKRGTYKHKLFLALVRIWLTLGQPAGEPDKNVFMCVLLRNRKISIFFWLS